MPLTPARLRAATGDITLMNIQMPGMNGIAAIAAIPAVCTALKDGIESTRCRSAAFPDPAAIRRQDALSMGVLQCE